MTSSYPSPETAARFPFVPHPFEPLDEATMIERARSFHDTMAGRRSARVFSDKPVPRELIDLAIATAATAPSGAHQQPWTFVVIGDPDTKRKIRDAAEEEERKNYEGGRMNDEWRAVLEPLGTHSNKEYLELVPWIVVAFEQRYSERADGTRQHHYYVKESLGIACGMFIAALHTMGLTTLTHTPSPMKFLSHLLERPQSERPFVLFPIGYPEPGSLVPDIDRKPIDEVMITYPPS